MLKHVPEAGRDAPQIVSAASTLTVTGEDVEGVADATYVSDGSTVARPVTEFSVALA